MSGGVAPTPLLVIRRHLSMLAFPFWKTSSQRVLCRTRSEWTSAVRESATLRQRCWRRRRQDGSGCACGGADFATPWWGSCGLGVLAEAARAPSAHSCKNRDVDKARRYEPRASTSPSRRAGHIVGASDITWIDREASARIVLMSGVLMTSHGGCYPRPHAAVQVGAILGLNPRLAAPLVLRFASTDSTKHLAQPSGPRGCVLRRR